MRNVLLTFKGQRPDVKWLLPRHDRRLYFCRRFGRHETHIGRLRKTILGLAEAAKIPVHVTHHVLRHCNSTHNRKMGATDYEVMELLGQQSTKVHSLYTHAEWQGIVEASKRLGQSIGSDGLSMWLSRSHRPTKF
jgi:site-specific recombinase XerD